MIKTILCEVCGEEKQKYVREVCKTCYGRIYREENKNNTKAYNEQYRKDNHDKLKEYHNKYRKENNEIFMRSQKKYKEANVEKIKEKDKEYYRNNRDRVLKSSKDWKRNNPEKVIKTNKKWCGENREKVRATCHKRRTSKSMNGGSYTDKEWKKLIKKTGNKCLACNVSGNDVLLTVDHIIPVFKGGTSNIDNLQPLCGPCNSSKGIKTINYRKDI